MKIARCTTFQDELFLIVEYATTRFTSFEHIPEKEIVRLYYNSVYTGTSLHFEGVEQFLNQYKELSLIHI